LKKGVWKKKLKEVIWFIIVLELLIENVDIEAGLVIVKLKEFDISILYGVSELSYVSIM
jgi:hypothetical protein